MQRNIFKLWLICGLVMAGMIPLGDDGSSVLIGAAQADDDDDDDDDDDRFRVRRAPTVRRAAPAPAPLPTRAPNEVIATRLSDEDLSLLVDEGYAVLEETQLTGFDDATARRLRTPNGVTEQAARDRVRALNTGAEADFNHYYRPEASPAQASAAPCDGQHCGDRAMIGWNFDAQSLSACLGNATIGVVDTGVNEDHEAFKGAKIEVHRLAPDKAAPSHAVHGTAVTALLVGRHDSRSPGLLPGAQVIAIDVFHRSKGDERADAYSLIEGISLLAERGVDVINLSLAGPPNTELAQAMITLDKTHNIIAVASTGNEGARARARFPAAYPSVIAVTAVDRNQRIYRRAGSGNHVAFAAPGVDVWTAASVSGARGKTGTSFAAPFVSATIAVMRGQNPTLTAAEARDILARDAIDLGPAGRDDTYGHGLLSAPAACAPARLTPVSN